MGGRDSYHDLNMAPFERSPTQTTSYPMGLDNATSLMGEEASLDSLDVEVFNWDATNNFLSLPFRNTKADNANVVDTANALTGSDLPFDDGFLTLSSLPSNGNEVVGGDTNIIAEALDSQLTVLGARATLAMHRLACPGSAPPNRLFNARE